MPLVSGGHSLGRLETVGRHCGGSAGGQIATLATLLERLEVALGATLGRATLLRTAAGKVRGAVDKVGASASRSTVVSSVSNIACLDPLEEADGPEVSDETPMDGDVRKPR